MDKKVKAELNDKIIRAIKTVYDPEIPVDVYELGLIYEIDIKDNKEANSFGEIFDTKNIPKNIRKLVDEETLGISLGERRGIDILFGNIPKTGVIIDSKKEALRIKKNKLSKQDINSNPSPAVDINSGKPLLIK